ncbi:MAG: aminomethyl-transferring glycine dehydrogenase [Pseudanabaenaceae cyanobacterium]
MSPFIARHLGSTDTDIRQMLATLGLNTLEELLSKAVPSHLRSPQPLDLPPPLSETAALAKLTQIAHHNQVWRSYIGMGYANTITPPVIQRNILENPNWYTPYTPYQAEISQGRLEALLNFQTMVIDLTGMEIANASLLDEATACAEAMTMLYGLRQGQRDRFLVSSACHPQTIAVVKTRALPLGIKVVVGDHWQTELDPSYFGILLQYPTTDGNIEDYRTLVEGAHSLGAKVVVATDLLALTLLAPPGTWGADVVVGNSQRLGVPLGYGGPHAAFFATRDSYKRQVPGRMVGVSQDSQGRPALRLALQTREQHIRREKATSNICTAQVLLAVMASMYAVYHGAEGLKHIAQSIHRFTVRLAEGINSLGFQTAHDYFFDTLKINLGKFPYSEIQRRAEQYQINLRYYPAENAVGITLDETVTEQDLQDLVAIFKGTEDALGKIEVGDRLPPALQRQTPFLTHPVFQKYHTETELLRYMQRLQDKDISLTRGMIPLGSCTMKLNATAEMMPVSWAEFNQIHPFAPTGQTRGYQMLIAELASWLQEITGFAGVSLQPNAGSQGEYAGLLGIRAYHQARGQHLRQVCLIPQSAHGTNPASAVMAGMQVIPVQCDRYGNIDIADLKTKAEKHRDQLAALMVTYPSTHGVFEEGITEICDIIHYYGGQVYMDGANMNALVGICRPAELGIDVCHLNLHKTFCIPHGGGGPGVGPIAVKAHLLPFLPSIDYEGIRVAGAPWGSASILPISWMYIAMMGAEGLTKATHLAILHANYIAYRLAPYYPILYTGKHGFVAHECIIDLRPCKQLAGIEVEDIAKRLIDYGFHAPTVSWPVAGTMMIEPTESETKTELDLFCEAMIAIRKEIEAIAAGKLDRQDNPLKHAPHPAYDLIAGTWQHAYSREQAAYPLPYLKENKYWSPVSRIDNAYGDRHFFCSCAAFNLE